MGIIKNGILGGFRKKTGTVVGAYWRKLDVIRALPRSSGKAPTALQVEQRLKFGMVTSFLSPLQELIEEGFHSPGDLRTAMNRAVAYHLKSAVRGAAPDFSIDPERLSYSQGKVDLPHSVNVSVTDEAPAGLEITWTNAELEGKYHRLDDMATILVYNETQGRFIKAPRVAQREARVYTVALPADFLGHIHVYLSFTGIATKLLKSNTRYVGEVIVV